MPTTLNDRVRTHRRNLRASGLRPIQIWVPDTRRAGFAEECIRQSKVVAHSTSEQELTEFVESASEDEWE
ncbi:antitoxin MazE family protein [Robbsia andropogonis]|uniref:antitoxin MazE family protein n=1 Tax=Robbsia andropogonis TaxID=28092 RepID=UPI00209F1AF6|nr:antitoxin MazE family protein [Robbsia andropogonis]MCP1116929.1 antitoxin MazE family protein [Robbsia andropogonis]MCP1126392.1 antitoxin MazE family protein [Robbsia andropogonis]